MPFPIVRPNPSAYHRTGPSIGSSVGGIMAGFVSSTGTPNAISRSSTSTTVLDNSQIMHPNVAASAYEMNWMNLGAENYDEMAGPSGYGAGSNQFGNEYGSGSGGILVQLGDMQNSSQNPEGFGNDAPSPFFQPLPLDATKKRADHQYSTDDEEFEEVGTSDNEGVSVTLEQSNTTSSMMPPQSEDDSQQAAEAMVQLSGAQYYNAAQDDTMEIDPNYDPSDFLGMSNRQQTSDAGRNETSNQPSSETNYSIDQSNQNSEYSQDSRQVSEATDQQQFDQQLDTNLAADSGSQQQPQSSALPALQTLHSDLAISDSDDEKSNLQMDEVRDENDDNDEGGDLWF
uniref:Uncharacterized protein n=1 Tax=Anopheles maculatus TaxID=74869 RepID=A0A182TBU3_9DIPT